MLKKKFLVIAVAIVILLIAGLAYGALKFTDIASYLQPEPKITGMILFYGAGCPQCDKVDDFVKANKIAEKVAFTELEVFNDAHNAKILGQKAKVCGLEVEQIGVPFLWDGKGCEIGYIDIIKFFQDAVKVKK